MRRISTILLFVLPATLTLLAIAFAILFLREWGVLLVPFIVLSVTLMWLAAVAMIAAGTWLAARLSRGRTGRPAPDGGASPHT